MDFRSSAIIDAPPNLGWLFWGDDVPERTDKNGDVRFKCLDLAADIGYGNVGMFMDDHDRRKLWRDLYEISLGYSELELEGLFDGFNDVIDEIEEMILMLVAKSERKVREAYAVAVAAVVLLSYVYLYLTGCGGWDGSRAVSSGSLDYREIYIAIVLFQGSYVWIKFRDVAPTKSIPAGAVYEVGTPRKDGGIKKTYEPRFKPRKENGVSFDRIYVGRYDSHADAEVVYRMTASCYDYGKDYGTPLDLAGDGRELFIIIPEFTPAEKTLSGRAKNDLVKKRVQEHFKRYKTEKDALNLAPTLPGASLEQELENRRLQSEILRERQQNEDLARQLQQSQHLQQEQMIQIQNLQRQVEGLQIEDLHEPMTTAEIDSWMHDLQGIDLQLQFNDRQPQQNLQQAQQFQFQNSEPQVEDLQRPVQDQQTQQYLQQAQQFQALNLQPRPQLSSLQQHQREEELLPIGENCDVPFATEPTPVVPESGADIGEWMNMEPFQEEPGLGLESPSFWEGICI